jgi:hypothetical protein
MESLPPNPANPMDTPSPSNQYVINNVQQLFELNPNMVNFKSTFMVKSLTNEPFMGLVVNQQILDSGNMPEFKSADQGFFSGEISQDNNLYTNWYLVLKSQKPNKVVLQIQSVPIPPRDAQEDPYRNLDVHPYGHGHPHGHLREGYGSYFTMNNVMTAVAVGAAIAACYLAYKYYKERSVKTTNINSVAASLMPSGESMNKPSQFIQPLQNTMAQSELTSSIAPSTSSIAQAIPTLPLKSPPRMELPSTPASIEVPPSLNLGGSSTGDILGSDLMKQINNLPTI